jgi:hypothetical protein
MKRAVLWLGASQIAAAQCSMCRTAAGVQAAQSDALNTGILILLVPALLLFTAVIIVTVRKAG